MVEQLRGLVFGMAAVAALAANAFEVVEKDGRLSVCDGTRIVVSGISVERDGASGSVRRGRSDGDGAKVWNEWDETRDGRYRLEVAERADGSVEITMSGQVDPYDKVRSRYLRLDVPKGVLDGLEYRMLAGNGRKWDERRGTLDESFASAAPGDCRWFAAGGYVFDFNPIGAGDYCSTYQDTAIKGVCSVAAKKGGGFEIRGGSRCGRSYGGYTGAKVVIRKGVFEDYDRYHFVRAFRYSDHLKASHALSFGADKTGRDFTDGHVAWQAGKRFGWERLPASAACAKGAKEGVLYSAVTGSDKAVYRIDGLADGYYAVTFSAGNFTGTENAFGFDVRTADGDVWTASALSVAPKTARRLSRAVHVRGGALRFALNGRWLVSSIAVQPVMGDGEDFSVSRGFWFSDGYEPCALFRNADYAAKPVFPVADETIDLPEPGTECAGNAKPIPAPVELPDPDDPALAWVRTARIGRCLANNVSMAEFDDPATRAKWFDDNVEGHGFNVLFFSGMHSRHTYTGNLERGIEATRRQAAEAHRRGMKYIDHHDATLNWNVMGGFRSLMERLPELIRSKTDGLPSYQFCPCNEAFNRRYYAYLRRLVEAGVDGFQIDEIGFWKHGCVCADCRRKFHADTGWSLPANECHPAFTDKRNPLARVWFEWRRKALTNWFVGLRQRVKDVKPDLVVCMYTTHHGFIMNAVDAAGHADLIDAGRAVNFFGTEVMTRNVMQSARCLPVYRKMYRLLNLAYGCPLWGFYYGSTPENAYFATCLGNMNGELAMPPEVARPYGIPDAVAFCGSPYNMVRAGAESVAEVAVLFSSYSRDWNEGVSSNAEALGLAQELEAMHVPYDIIGDIGLEGDVSKYKVLFIGAAQCLSDREIASLRAFAERGGRVYMRPTAGSRNAVGEPRPEGALDYPLSPSAGAFFAKELTPPNKKVFSYDAARARAFRAEIAKLVAGADVWRTDAPGGVFTTVWRETKGPDGRATVVHFLNATGCDDLKVGETCTFASPKVPFPALEKDVVFTIGGGKSATAYSPDFGFGGRSLAARRNADGTLTVTLPKELLKGYTIVRIK